MLPIAGEESEKVRFHLCISFLLMKSSIVPSLTLTCFNLTLVFTRRPHIGHSAWSEMTNRVHGDGKEREREANVKSNRGNTRKQRRDIRTKCESDEGMWRAFRQAQGEIKNRERCQRQRGGERLE